MLRGGLDFSSKGDEFGWVWAQMGDGDCLGGGVWYCRSLPISESNLGQMLVQRLLASGATACRPCAWSPVGWLAAAAAQTMPQGLEECSGSH